MRRLQIKSQEGINQFVADLFRPPSDQVSEPIAGGTFRVAESRGGGSTHCNSAGALKAP